MVNLYYTEIPVGLDLSYVIYPAFIFTNKEQIRRKYKSISKVYFDFNQCGQQFHSFEIFTFIITPLSNKYVEV